LPKGGCCECAFVSCVVHADFVADVGIPNVLGETSVTVWHKRQDEDGDVKPDASAFVKWDSRLRYALQKPIGKSLSFQIAVSIDPRSDRPAPVFRNPSKRGQVPRVFACPHSDIQKAYYMHLYIQGNVSNVLEEYQPMLPKDINEHTVIPCGNKYVRIRRDSGSCILIVNNDALKP
jgi:hypothetical protein